VLIFNEPSGSGSNFTSMRATSQDTDVSYFLPDTQGVENSVLFNDGSGNLTWASMETFASSFVYNVTVIVTASYNVRPEDNHVIVDNSSAATIALPSASTLRGKVYFVKKISDTGGPRNVTVDPYGSETIDGDATYLLDKLYEGVMIVSDESNWYIMSEIAR